MLICGVDFETTGLDNKVDDIIEIGAAIFDGETWKVKDTLSHFVNPGKPIPLMITELTGINDEMVKDGITIAGGVQLLDSFVKDCDFFIAHNAQFDKGMLMESIGRHGILVSERLQIPWLCSKSDVKTHVKAKCTKLSHLAVDYKLVVDGGKLHRALDDVLLMGQMLQRTGLTAKEIWEWSQEPWVYMKALCAPPWKDNGKSTIEAKSMGFSWERCTGTYEPVFPKKWVRRVKVSELEEEKARVAQTFKRVTITETPK